MRPFRLLFSLGSSLIALTLLLYLAFGSQRQGQVHKDSSAASKGRVKALFSFTSPASLFPPSAIISLTDDNSTFFLARPAAYGPLLPTKGLSGPLWIGSGFGDEAMGRGELGCSDVPGWNDGDDSSIATSSITLGSEDEIETSGGMRSATRTKRTQNVEKLSSSASKKDGTDDHLHQPLRASKMHKSSGGKSSEHADIQSLQEGAEIAGKVVLLKRGGCGFLEKTKWAQRRGAVALVVGDEVRGGALIVMNARGDTSNVTIPSLFTSHTTAHLLSSLLPSGGFIQDLSPEDAAKLQLIKNGKAGKHSKNKQKTGKTKTKAGGSRPTSTQTAATAAEATSTSAVAKVLSTKLNPVAPTEDSEEIGWFRSILHALGFGSSGRTTPKDDNWRSPSSGNLDWVQIQEWDDDHSGQKPFITKTATKTSLTTTTQAPGDFVIGEEDWRDPDLLPQQTFTNEPPQESAKPRQTASKLMDDSVLPGSGEYNKDKQVQDHKPKANAADELHKGWFSNLLGHGGDDTEDVGSELTEGSNTKASTSNAHSQEDEEDPDEPDRHEGLWVTLAPTNMSSSPFFDTLLVLVVSPLVTLTVVYALLLLRSRIRRRRWRAPKSVVERLPVRTYHTISDASSSPTATPSASSPTTPLLQHPHSPTHSRPPSSLSRPRSRTAPEVAASSSVQQASRQTEEEKREAGLAEWRRRYGGRQRECVVCLEEYVDGISRVMSLPCGHEFHADCITPWLVTRRRTCPICKGDVVRSLSQSYRDRGLRSPSPARTRRFFDDPDTLQEQAAETRNDSPSASRPVPISTSLASEYRDDFDADVEANWADGGAEGREESGRDIPRDHGVDLSSSMRDLSSTVSTTIWRGFEAVRSAAGLQRRPSQQEVDRDR